MNRFSSLSPPDYYKAFQFDKNYVIRNKTAIEDIVANGDSMDLDTDGSFKLYAYMNTKDDFFTAPDSQAFLRCTMDSTVSASNTRLSV